MPKLDLLKEYKNYYKAGKNRKSKNSVKFPI